MLAEKKRNEKEKVERERERERDRKGERGKENKHKITKAKRQLNFYATAESVDAFKENVGGDEPELEYRDVVDTQEKMLTLLIMARIRMSS